MLSSRKVSTWSATTKGSESGSIRHDPGLIVTSRPSPWIRWHRTQRLTSSSPSRIFWWNFGTGQGDWINEAFAEYFSAVAVQKISSEQEFSPILSDYHMQVADLPRATPSLANVPSLNGEHGFVVRYYKGSLMLHKIREVMGAEEFFQACHDFFQTYSGQSISTAEFRNFWYAKLGANKEF